MRGESGPVRVFYSYSHHDEALLTKLRRHLAPLRRRGLIVEWSDRAIDAGTDWAGAIERELRSADLILLLISKHFIDSDFCYGTELTAALEREARGEARVIPVILSPCLWQKLPFARLQAVPRDDRAVTASYWANEDEAFNEVAARIEAVVEALCAAPAPAPVPNVTAAAAPIEKIAPQPLLVPARPQPKNGVYIGVDPATLPDLAVFKDVDKPWCPEMVVIPAGSFLMGSPPGEEGRHENEGPQHRVTFACRFAIGRYAVTFDEYDHFCAATARKMLGDRGWGRGRRPVINVSWLDAQAYGAWLSQELGRSYGLTSEAAWEYACRAGTTTPYSFGRAITPDQANFYAGPGKTVDVGSLPANPWGLYEMHGNVGEWVEDAWHDSYVGAPSDGAAWANDQGASAPVHRPVRGGSWIDVARWCRSPFRGAGCPDSGDDDLGFRLSLRSIESGPAG
ncbi:MAG TPA: SUMF1/EgtB/PvdO family nonheme iron enzyme [Rhodospirillales bacterium]|nr:SUMF1/EgtB/PvdO family nonheme iron enzyme [Rhodospirillales bacterium]